ncbi:hypothetical protein SRHO_G00322270 [Serrasalmus rhombeus]
MNNTVKNTAAVIFTCPLLPRGKKRWEELKEQLHSFKISYGARLKGRGRHPQSCVYLTAKWFIPPLNRQRGAARSLFQRTSRMMVTSVWHSKHTITVLIKGSCEDLS